MSIDRALETEATTTELSKVHNPKDFDDNREIARRGGKYAGDARKSIEADTGRPVVTSKNAMQLNTVVIELLEEITENKNAPQE